MDKLVYQSLWYLGFLHDAFPVVLSDGATHFVVVHGWAVLASSPQTGDFDGVFDLEDTLRKMGVKSKQVV